MKYVEAMFEPNSGAPEECGATEVQIGLSAHGRILAAIKVAILESKGKADEIGAGVLASSIVEIAGEEIDVDEHHAEFDSELDGDFSPLDRLGSIRHKLMLAGILPHEVVAIVRLSDLVALIAERDELREDRELATIDAEGRDAV